MPSATVSRSIQTVITDVVAIQGSSLYKFVQPSGRGAIDAAEEMLQNMEAGDAVKIEDIPGEGFMRQVLDRCQFFARWRNLSGDAASSDLKTLFGKEALEQNMRDLSEAAAEPAGIAIDDLAIPTMLCHLLSAKNKQVLAQLLDETVHKALGASASAPEGTSSGSVKATAVVLNSPRARRRRRRMVRNKCKCSSTVGSHRMRGAARSWI
jgi:hypothetical protein